MRRDVWNIGHRGAAALEPENTVRSFRRAAAEGATALELDLRLTGDGRLVVLHDPTLDRTTDGTGPVDEATLAGLQRYDAGLGERVPTFEETLLSTDLPVYAEIKAIEAAEPLASTILTGNLDGRVTPICFYPEPLRRVRRILPDQPVGLICSEVSAEVIENARSVGATLISARAACLNAATMRLLRQSVSTVTAWTVNDAEEMRRLIDLSVDGVVTDRPDLLSGVYGGDETLE